MAKDFQQKDMEGVLFKNDEATPENKQPIYSGSITIKGEKFNLGAWINTGKTSGKKFMSLRAQAWGKKESRERAQASSPQASREPGSDDFQDDDLPPFIK